MRAQVNRAFPGLRRLKRLTQSLFRGSALKQAPRAYFKADDIELALAACFAHHASVITQRTVRTAGDIKELTGENRALRRGLEIGSGGLFQGSTHLLSFCRYPF